MDRERNPEDTPELFVERDGPICTITLNRPERLNSLSLNGIKALLASLRSASRDGSIGALVISGTGRGFCAGWHLDEDGVPGLPDETLGVRQAHLMAEYFNPVIEAMRDMPVPTIASINGVCAGAGVSLALAADIAIAARSASFVLTFAPRLGIIPDLGATWILPRSIGWAKAQAIALLGERIGAPTAVDWGMIFDAVEDDALASRTKALTDRLAASPPRVALEVRRAFHAAQRNSLTAQLEYERLRQRDLLDTPAFAEGLLAFQEKREPRFHQQTPADK
ncbi:enoyl-CoA hydratase/isomerase family protein [Ensifer sp. ENS07]|uniref:enoyl-CoA hydratase-related protein n=1 Tax=Ensifer sp. ENS07 TaxID=2769274 RepID=UPI0017824A1A|nr:enoyl-CoA hydratase-related protein [Ensifer sp. ENS07]MBD9641778.1 enoyl-CoA hydratase/isomerase family protein [Ensifer sp. ENS07]